MKFPISIYITKMSFRNHIDRSTTKSDDEEKHTHPQSQWCIGKKMVVYKYENTSRRDDTGIESKKYSLLSWFSSSKYISRFPEYNTPHSKKSEQKPQCLLPRKKIFLELLTRRHYSTPKNCDSNTPIHATTQWDKICFFRRLRSFSGKSHTIIISILLSLGYVYRYIRMK